jgi:hypothetical protein
LDIMMPRRKILFICGTRNQTTQMHAIARHLPDYEQRFTPYYADGPLDFARRAGLLEFTVLGHKLQERCRVYLREHGLAIDESGAEGDYDLALTCSDLVVPRNCWNRRLVLVQEGILDPPSFGLTLYRKFRVLPRWLAGTATTGLSLRYQRFCVASEGYRDHFLELGIPPERLVVTGIPNFDDCERYHNNDFPHRGYVLACTSDARETFKGDRREDFIRHVLGIAKGRQVVFKLHPNENAPRAEKEIKAIAPDALVYATGSAEEMIANCDVLVVQYSSTVFVGLALGKEVHSYWDLASLRRLMPVQNASAARNIAAVCRQLLEEEAPEGVAAELDLAPALTKAYP